MTLTAVFSTTAQDVFIAQYDYSCSSCVVEMTVTNKFLLRSTLTRTITLERLNSLLRLPDSNKSLVFNKFPTCPINMVRNICHLYMTEDVGGHFKRRGSISKVSWTLIFEDFKLSKIQNVRRVMDYESRRETELFFCSSIFVTNWKQLTWLIYTHDFVWNQQWLLNSFSLWTKDNSWWSFVMSAFRLLLS